MRNPLESENEKLRESIGELINRMALAEAQSHRVSSAMRLLTARLIGVSNDTVYKWIDKHGMPAHRMGRLWKFKKDEVDAWVKSGGADEPTDIDKQDNE